MLKSIGISLAGGHASRKWIRDHKDMGYKPKPKRKTLLMALSEARDGMTWEERVERLCDTINNSKRSYND